MANKKYNYANRIEWLLQPTVTFPCTACERPVKVRLHAGINEDTGRLIVYAKCHYKPCQQVHKPRQQVMLKVAGSSDGVTVIPLD